MLGTGEWALTGRVEEGLTSLASRTRAEPIKLKLPLRLTLLLPGGRWSKRGFEDDTEVCVCVVPECARDDWLGGEGWYWTLADMASTRLLTGSLLVHMWSTARRIHSATAETREE